MAPYAATGGKEPSRNLIPAYAVIELYNDGTCERKMVEYS